LHGCYALAVPSDEGAGAVVHGAEEHQCTLRICLCDAGITRREFFGSERFWCRCSRDGRNIDRDNLLNGEFLALAINDFGRKNVFSIDFETFGFG
jgi:hypothetical protein